MSKRRKLTETECEVLSRNPAVKVAQPNRFVLHFEVSAFSGTDIIQHLSDHFKYNGYPSNGKNTIVGEIQRFRTNAEDNTYLISSSTPDLQEPKTPKDNLFFGASIFCV